MTLPRYDQPPAVVLGLGQNGLGTVRALGRVGVPVIGIDNDLGQPGAQTRFCHKVLAPDFAKGGPGLLQSLLELGGALERMGQKGVLIPSGDLNIQLISEEREQLAPYFHMSLPSKETLRLFLDKKSFYKLSMERGFPLPRTWFTDGVHDIDAIAREIECPCLIKPFQPNATWRETFDTRLFLADSPEMLKELYALIYPVHQDLIIQEYMPGDDSQVMWGVTYLDAQHQPLAVWTGRKLRMYPRGFGTATLAESMREPWIAESVVDILGAIGHRGYGVIEYKKDRRDGKLKITEATGGRTWFPHSLVTRSGINLPHIWYRDVLGLPVEKQTHFEEGIKWIHEERDLKTVQLYFLPEGRLTRWSWLMSYRGKRTYAYSAWDDPGPILNSLGRIVEAGVNRVKRRLRTKDTERARVEKNRPKKAMQEVLLAADPTVGHGLRRVTVD
jgi:D-aspartate ligase